jgi:exodeoxyribonuclease VII large subunit
MAVPVRAELRVSVLECARRLVGNMARFVEERATALRAEARGLPDPHRLLEDANQQFDDLTERLANGLRVNWQRHAESLAGCAARLKVAPAALLERRSENFIALGAGDRMRRCATRMIDDGALRLRHAAQVLETLSYQRVLERGFVLARDEDGEPVTASSATKPGMALNLRFHDGDVSTRVEGAPKPKRKPTKGDPGQGSLL